MPPDDSTITARRVMPVVIFIVFLDMLGVGILLPVVPQLLGNPASPEYLLPDGWKVSSGLIMLGFLTAAYSFAQFLAAPILGQLSDRFGRRPVLAVSLLGTSIGYAVFAIGILQRNIPLLFAARAFDGITGGNIAVAQAAVADVSTNETRTRNFGLVGATFGLGFIAGPYVGGKLASPGVDVISGLGVHTPSWFGADTPFWFAAALAALNTALVYLRFPETLHRSAPPSPIQWNRSFANIRRAAGLPGMRPIFATVFLYQSGFTFFTTFFAVYVTAKLGFSGNNVGDFFAYVGLWIAFTQGFLAPRLARRFSNWKVVRIAIPLLSLAILTCFIPGNTTQLLLITWCVPVTVGCVFANATALVSASAPPDIQGEVLGINASVQALAQAIPAALTGFLGSIDKSVPLYASSAAIALAALVFATQYRPPVALAPTSRSTPTA
jgi:DHA1 family tetracycline resistance protein-like MFS transporter